MDKEKLSFGFIRLLGSFVAFALIVALIIGTIQLIRLCL
jgi:hypothetical protein